jgi:hypothetical protein
MREKASPNEGAEVNNRTGSLNVREADYTAIGTVNSVPMMATST